MSKRHSDYVRALWKKASTLKPFGIGWNLMESVSSWTDITVHGSLSVIKSVGTTEVDEPDLPCPGGEEHVLTLTTEFCWRWALPSVHFIDINADAPEAITDVLKLRTTVLNQRWTRATKFISIALRVCKSESDGGKKPVPPSGSRQHTKLARKPGPKYNCISRLKVGAIPDSNTRWSLWRRATFTNRSRQLVKKFVTYKLVKDWDDVAQRCLCPCPRVEAIAMSNIKWNSLAWDTLIYGR